MLFVGCKKKWYEPKKEFIKTSPYLKSINFRKISSKNGLLKFQNFKQVRTVIKKLGQAYRNRDKDFLSLFPNKNGYQLMNIEDSLDYNDKLIYRDFVKRFNYISLYSNIEKEQKKFVEQKRNSNSEPEDNFVIQDEARCILNQNAEVIVYDTIYKFYPWGYFKIPNENFHILNKIRESISNALKFDNIKTFGNPHFIMGDGGVTSGPVTSNPWNPPTDPCAGVEGWKMRSGKKIFANGTKRIKWKVGIRSWPWGRFVIAKSKNQIRSKFLGIKTWKGFRCQTKVQVWGYVVGFNTENGAEEDCSEKLSFNTKGSSHYAEAYN